MLDDTMDAEDCHALPRREVELTANDDSVPQKQIQICLNADH